MNLADKMVELATEYEDQFFDPEVFRYIIKLIRTAAEQGERRLILRVRGSSNRYASLMRHLRNEGFIVTFLYGPACTDGEIAPNSLSITWV